MAFEQNKVHEEQKRIFNYLKEHGTAGTMQEYQQLYVTDSYSEDLVTFARCGLEAMGYVQLYCVEENGVLSDDYIKVTRRGRDWEKAGCPLIDGNAVAMRLLTYIKETQGHSSLCNFHKSNKDVYKRFLREVQRSLCGLGLIKKPKRGQNAWTYNMRLTDKGIAKFNA